MKEDIKDLKFDMEEQATDTVLIFILMQNHLHLHTTFHPVIPKIFTYGIGLLQTKVNSQKSIKGLFYEVSPPLNGTYSILSAWKKSQIFPIAQQTEERA